jgi:molecular chaperone GrpE
MSESTKKKLKPKLEDEEGSDTREEVSLEKVEVKQREFQDTAGGQPEVSLEKAEVKPKLEIETLKEEREALREQLKRMQAEYENFRKRKTDEYEEYKKYIVLELFKKLLPVLDNLERAYDSVQKHKDLGALCSGIELVVKQFKEILEKEGAQELPGVGEVFDPAYHEAVLREESKDSPEGTILEVLQKGYRYKDRLLRPSLVKVSG